MAVHHEWQSGGGTLDIPGPDVGTEVLLTPSFGTRLVKFMLHGVSIYGKNAGLTADVIEPLILHYEVLWPGTAEDPFTIYTATRRIPMETDGFFADAVDVYNVTWYAGDSDMGFSEQCSRGKHSDGFLIPVKFRWYPIGVGTFNYEDHIQMNYTFAALWDYLAP